MSLNEPNPESAAHDPVSFLPVLAYEGAKVTQIDAGGIPDIAVPGNTARQRLIQSARLYAAN